MSEFAKRTTKLFIFKWLAVRVGFGTSPLLENTQVIDSTKRQNRQSCHFRRSEVHGGYTGPKFGVEIPGFRACRAVVFLSLLTLLVPPQTAAVGTVAVVHFGGAL